MIVGARVARVSMWSTAVELGDAVACALGTSGTFVCMREDA